MEFELLLAGADDRQPILKESLPLDAAAQQSRPEAPRSPEHLFDQGGDPDSLSLQRWGVVAPEGPRGDRLLELIAPLRAVRREQQQGVEPRVYRVPPGLDDSQSIQWMKTVLHDERVPTRDQPRYLLLLGDFDQVSFGLQQVLASDGFVGRLALSSDAGYEAYVDKVLRWARAPLPVHQARALFYTAHDGTPATIVGYHSLVTATLERCRELQERGDFPAGQLSELGRPSDWSRERLLEQVTSPQASLLFTLSHGLGAPRGGWRSVDEQRARQGAMSLGDHGTLDASALASTPFLPGGIWFYLACFGAGTPARSAYHPWLSRLREAGAFAGRVERVLESLPREGERPFVAALPQAVLANPQGPLAMVGHVDLAWTCSFLEPERGGRARPSRFHGLLNSLVRGRRAGVGLGELLRFFTQANTELTLLHDQEEVARTSGRGNPVEPARRAHLWMMRHDLAGYILLGDPAVTLPLARQEQAVQSSSPAERISSLLGMSVAKPPGGRLAPSSQLPAPGRGHGRGGARHALRRGESQGHRRARGRDAPGAAPLGAGVQGGGPGGTGAAVDGSRELTNSDGRFENSTGVVGEVHHLHSSGRP